MLAQIRQLGRRGTGGVLPPAVAGRKTALLRCRDSSWALLKSGKAFEPLGHLPEIQLGSVHHAVSSVC